MSVCVCVFLEYLNTFAQEDTKHFLMLTLEKEMATHSSILAWKIPWMEEPGRDEILMEQAKKIIFFPHSHSVNV